MNETLKFIRTIQECVKEYRKEQRETDGTDTEIAHFFSPKLKKYLIDHKDEVIALSALNCERPFMSFVTHYIYN